MADVTVFATFIILIASFIVSVVSARRRSSNLLSAFLFSGNTPLLGFSSCIGSIISMAVAFTALLSAGYEWGWQIIFPMVSGCALGLAAILKLTEHSRLRDDAIVEKKDFQYGASYLATFGSASTSLYYGFAIAAYAAMLITELVVLRGFIGFLTGLPEAEVVLTIATILFVCYGYVYIGGFRGVLVTDYFQLMVVFVFVGLWLTAVWRRPSFHFPSPTAAHDAFTSVTYALLCVGIFGGAFAWMFASVDQWYRTVGTLSLGSARRVLIGAAIALCLGSIIPVMAGAAAVGRADIPSHVTNGVSLILIFDLLSHANTTLRFVFAMALTCAALTTLNTYVITMQQLYYEAETRIDSPHWQHFVFVSFPLKWKQVRGFVAVLTIIAFVASCFFPAAYVYAFGVGALSTFILMLPFVAAALCEILESSRNRIIRRVATAVSGGVMAHGTAAIAIGVIIWALLLIACRMALGSLSSQLYVIPATAFSAACVAVVAAVGLHSIRALRKEAA